MTCTRLVSPAGVEMTCVSRADVETAAGSPHAPVGVEVVHEPRAGLAEEPQLVRRSASPVLGDRGGVEVWFERRVDPVSELSSALPITAVPTTMPSASKATSVRLRLGSVTSRG